MAKRPTPKRRRSRSKMATQHEAFRRREIKRLEGRMQSPYGKPAQRKPKAKKPLEGVTRVKA